MRAQIRFTGGSLSGQTIEVDRAKLIIGREEDCHLRTNSEFISRHHCALLLDDYTLRIRDLGSKNGSFVNGRRIGAGDTEQADASVLPPPTPAAEHERQRER